MKMNELTLSERIFLDKLNKVNRKFVKNEMQSLWNVCYGYLHKFFDSNLLYKSDEEIAEVLQRVNMEVKPLSNANYKCAKLF